MGTSVKMIEQHYGHITHALKAQEIAGKRHVPRVAAVDAMTEEDKNLAEPITTVTSKKATKRRTTRVKT